MLEMYLELILMTSKAMLFSLIGFEIQTCIIIYESICNIISAATLRM